VDRRKAHASGRETAGPGRVGSTAAIFARDADVTVKARALGINNARLEAMNSTARLIPPRAPRAGQLDPFHALIQLVCGTSSVAAPA